MDVEELQAVRSWRIAANGHDYPDLGAVGVPVFTIVLAWVFLGEAPSLLELAGIVLMLGGLLIFVLAPQTQAAASVSQVPSW